MNRLCLCFLLCLSLVGCSKESQQEPFDAFLEQQFQESISTDYLSYRTLVKDPKNFGMDAFSGEVSLGLDLDEASLREESKAYKKQASLFQSFNRSLLSPRQQDVYDAMAFEWKRNEATEADVYLYYPQIFTSGAGLPFQLATLFADWTIETEQDVLDVMALLKDVRPTVQSALAYVKKQEQLETLIIDAKAVRDYCAKIVEQGMESSILLNLLEQVRQAGFTQYEEEISSAFASSFLVAYQDIMDTMETLDSMNPCGYASLPKGKTYFQELLRMQTGLEQNPLQIKQKMEMAFEEHVQAYQKAYTQDVELALTTSFSSYEEMISFTQEQMVSDFPEVVDLSYSIVNMNPEIASNGGVAAYYQVCPLDGSSVHQLRVNPQLHEDLSSLSTYQTVCHEAIPGHMYQTQYLYNLDVSNYQKGLLSYLGYTEGYATYVEFEVLEYLDLDPRAFEMYKENQLAFHCLLAAADIGIHYEGYSVQDVWDYFYQHGFELGEASVQSIYAQLRANPAVFEAYYVGYEEIMDIKEERQEALQDAFCELDFHKALLDCGPAPFSVVSRYIKRHCVS